MEINNKNDLKLFLDFSLKCIKLMWVMCLGYQYFETKEMCNRLISFILNDEGD